MEVVGALMWLTLTRPDLLYAVKPRTWVIWPFLAPKEVRFASSEWDPPWSHGLGGRDQKVPHFCLGNGNPLQRILWLGTRPLRPYRKKRQN